jgi:addiction module RelB/DinJ family antitoxin
MRTIAQPTIDFRKIDAKTQEQAAAVFKRMGLDQETAINLFYHQVAIEQRLPFQPSAQSSIGDQVLRLAALNKTPISYLDTDENGNIIIDERTPEDIVDWAKNG